MELEYREINSREEFRTLKYKDLFSIGHHTFVATSNVLMDPEGDYYLTAQKTRIPMKEGCLGELGTEVVTIKDKDLAFWKEKTVV